MLNNQTMEKLHTLRLPGMAESYRKQNGRRGDGWPELRGTFRTAGGSALDLAGKPSHGASAEEV